jgi:hypothetical protein
MRLEPLPASLGQSCNTAGKKIVQHSDLRDELWISCNKRSLAMAALPLIVFDVNETLLDLETMEPTFERIFGDKSAMRL